MPCTCPMKSLSPCQSFNACFSVTVQPIDDLRYVCLNRDEIEISNLRYVIMPCDALHAVGQPPHERLFVARRATRDVLYHAKIVLSKIGPDWAAACSSLWLP